MLEKAKRDFVVMASKLNTDTIFNFFVTVYHVIDYVKKQTKTSEANIETFYKSPDFQMCEYICNKGKHLTLRNEKERYPYQNQHRKAATFGEMMFNEGTFNQSESYTLIAGDREVDVVTLGKRLLDNWERFFKDNGI